MSNTIYIEYNFSVSPLQPGSDILIAELGEAGFESFVENEEGVLAYIQKEDWNENILETVEILDNPIFEVGFSIKEIEQENWNATWEKNFEAIQVADQCVVRAPFHEKPDVAFDIVIEPKMSFGTGHHETTYMMLQFVLENDFEGKDVLDMGSGTGVLAILAALKKAAHIDAIDIDNWCYLNAKENVERNNCSHISVFEGDSSLLGERKYDVILANINRNILLADIPVYAQNLRENGALFLSGFYEEDIPLISETCLKAGLKFEKNLQKNNWVAVKYVF
ncbi:50S ribosomal protein L11 methyltransferase [Zobellia galactanivorans]|uniref:50S ribosomal protein L11 methyltransferase n=1 Tax=Zobellia galactanivorans (strain DSM 12802 / CCUG 47099 / CIP 106680 / NCIMB 13871 / Dsij) TaxID=63186 RepID=UPI001C0721EF|nr:50S ribosomal protein L11 methyltransferase [Zobellia galactanivorans]MBU3025395.1 50S ribosomal protein L11 methyltransferase [Zobellia galactanivorans]